MALKTFPSTSPGQRHQIRVIRNRLKLQGKNDVLAKFGPRIPLLLKGFAKKAGRNNQGCITVRGKGGGHSHVYRIIDFKRLLWDVPAIVQRIEYDPNRSAFLALVAYNNGLLSYQIATHGLLVGQVLLSGPNAPLHLGNALPIANIPIGTQICLIEMLPKQGAVLCRSAGSSATIVKKNWSNFYGYALLQLNSGIFKYVSTLCMATIGQVSNLDHKNEILGKAGVSRWKGRRPIVRGVAKNPVDHPHGGGQGKTSGGRPSVTPYGIPTKGFITRTKPFNFRHMTSNQL